MSGAASRHRGIYGGDPLAGWWPFMPRKALMVRSDIRSEGGVGGFYPIPCLAASAGDGAEPQGFCVILNLVIYS